MEFCSTFFPSALPLIPTGVYSFSDRIMSNEVEYKKKILESLHATLGECVIPELGKVKKGKVRDIYFSGDNVIMVASDRVSAFDYMIPNLIPYKGEVLNKIAKYAFENTKDIIPNALVGHDVDPNVVVQRKLKNCGIECIVRGYLWGSMAAAYEKGDRVFCGLNVEDGLYRFHKFKEPLFTPTTKAEQGAPNTCKTTQQNPVTLRTSISFGETKARSLTS